MGGSTGSLKPKRDNEQLSEGINHFAASLGSKLIRPDPARGNVDCMQADHHDSRFKKLKTHWADISYS
jgi:hypothetical protein